MKRSEGELLKLIAFCEERLWLLDKAFLASDLKRNETIRHNIDCARQMASLCIEHLAARDTKTANIFADITLMRTNFASKIFEAERVEDLLGEADFLELSENWEKDAASALGAMERAVAILEAELQSQK